MLEKIALILVSTAIGAFATHFSKSYFDMGKPSIDIASITLDDVDVGESASIKAPDELAKLAVKSNWVPDLDEPLTIAESNEYVKNAESIILSLEKMTPFIESFDRFVKDNANEVNENISFKQRYLNFQRDNSDEFATFAAAIEGEIKRGVFQLKISDVVPGSNDGDSVNMLQNEARSALVVDWLLGKQKWNPEILRNAITHIRQTNNSDILILRQIVEKLKFVTDSSVVGKKQKQLNLALILKNNGRSTIAFDNYTSAVIENFENSDFFFSFADKVFPIIKPGEALLVEARQINSLNENQQKTIENLLGDSEFKLKVFGRVSTPGAFSEEWVVSSLDSVGGNQDLTLAKYREARKSIKLDR